MTQKKLVLIDGHALAYRAFFGMPDTFSTSSGEKTNAVYGFINMILSIWKDYNPDYFIITLDAGDTFRHEMFADYKGTREKMPDDLRHQISRIEQLVQAFNMPIFSKEGYEADDLLGTLAQQASEQGIYTIIVTGDRDLLQLVSPKVHVFIPRKGRFDHDKLYDEKAVEARYKLSVSQLVDLKALIGDSSDNIPGVVGIGPKIATQLLQEYNSLDDIYAKIDDVAKTHATKSGKPKSFVGKLRDQHDMAYLSQKLGQIVTDVPDVELSLPESKTTDFDMVDVANLFVELEFSTIFNRIPGAPADKLPQDIATVKSTHDTSILPVHSPIPPDGNYQAITSQKELQALIQRLKSCDRLAIDVETDSLDKIQANLVGIAISLQVREGFYIPLRHGKAPQQASLLPTAMPSDVPQLSLQAVKHVLAPILAAPNIIKCMHNAKFDMVILERHGMPIAQPICDTMIASWLMNNSHDARHGLKSLALNELNIKMTALKELIGSGKSQITMAQVPIDKATDYAAADTDMTLRLADVFPFTCMSKQALTLQGSTQQLRNIFEELELPLIYVLKDMELAGIIIDKTILIELGKGVQKRLHELTHKIHDIAGEIFNINSTKQLSDILFRKLGLSTKGLKRTKSGNYSTAAGMLEKFTGKHAIIDLILEVRGLAKLQSTYIKALQKLTNPRTGRVHTSYNQIGISSGRLSSSNPNLQNIPIRTEQGRQIRRAFVAKKGCKLIAADYSQVELRILAHIADDVGLKTAFANDEDIHTATASAVLGIEPENIDKYQRRIAKAINFGLAYGQTAYGLAQGTDMGVREAREFIRTYFQKYPGVKRYIEQTKRQVAQQGYVETLIGRRRDFPYLANLRGSQKERAEREAVNHPIQGYAADIMKRAMIDLHRALHEQGFQTKILLQVHDELVLEAPDDEVDTVIPVIKTIMQSADKLMSVPLKVNVEVGDNWRDMVEVW